MSREQPNNPLHGVTLAAMFERLVAHYGWAELGRRIDYERPLGQVVTLFRHEVTGPRERTAVAGGPVRCGHVRRRARYGPARVRWKGQRRGAA